MTTTEILSRGDLLTDCERSMRYHLERERFLNWANSFLQFLVFAVSSLGGGALVLGLFSTETVSVAVMVLVGLLALLILVWNPSRKASEHRALYQGFTRLHGVIYASEDPESVIHPEWTQQIHELYAQEPPVYRALHAQCANHVVIALGADRKFLADLKHRHRWFRNIFHFQNTDFFKLQRDAGTGAAVTAAENPA